MYATSISLCMFCFTERVAVTLARKWIFDPVTLFMSITWMRKLRKKVCFKFQHGCEMWTTFSNSTWYICLLGIYCKLCVMLSFCPTHRNKTNASSIYALYFLIHILIFNWYLEDVKTWRSVMCRFPLFCVFVSKVIQFHDFERSKDYSL